MKELKILVLSVLIFGLASGLTFAGSFETFTPWKIAKEVVEGSTSTDPAKTDIGGKVTAIEYKPSDIPLGTLSDALVIYNVSAGKWEVKTGVTPQLCDGNDLIATYKTGSGTNTLQFDKTGGGTGSISNEVKYKIKKESGGIDCNAPLASDDLSLTVPPGTSSTILTAKAGVAATQVIYDSASATLVSVLPEFTASVSLKADAKIGPALGFKKFSRDGTDDVSDDIKIKIEKASLDHPTTTNSGDKTTIKIALTDVSGLKETSVSIDQGFSCAFNLTTKIATCTKTAAAAAVEPKITFTVDGTTVLAERNFTATTEIDFATAGMKDRTVANDFALLKDADAGKWVFDATKVYVPLIGTNPDTGRETYIKLFSSVNTTIKGIVIASDGTSVVVDLGAIEAGKPKTITGAQLKELVEAQGKTVDGLMGFPAMFSITEAKENIFGYANMIDPSGAKRIPLSIESGVSN